MGNPMQDFLKANMWAITSIDYRELIQLFNGSFREVMNYVNKWFDDGVVDVMTYETWLSISREEI